MITSFHAKYYANELLHKKSYNRNARLSASLFDASLAINPHQIDAALFAFKSPLSKGVLLADEVGLGKTIEAGLVMCQLWAERKRKQIVICPAALRKQWSLELIEKFNISSVILENKTYKEFMKQGQANPFLQDKVVIVSYHYASKMYQDMGAINWDLVIIDEAHKLRNSYRSSNKLGQGIKLGTKERKKLLLTATPLQNNLTELYGLSSVIDEHFFGDIKTFRDNYVNNDNTEDLKERLSYFCKRTLRKDVMEYVKYTERFPIVKKFSASDEEQALYEGLSEFLQRDNTYAVPYRQKHITTLVIRKVMASSTWAVLQTLETILDRLVKVKEGVLEVDSNIEGLVDEDEFEILEETIEELEEISEEKEFEIDINKLNDEIQTINKFIHMAKNIKTDTKSNTLLEALKIGFEEIAIRGGNRKALIFTESKRTQYYLKHFLENAGYSGKIAIFNGTNSGTEVTAIYKEWCEKNKYNSRMSGSPTADKRNAIIEYFRDVAEILIATESASEGVNLQFCSLVINYDLPWNPQRIEQRIGRCHRYGQKNDVVVINFINDRNYADVRVHELLDEKFNLFCGVFGSSDEVLGSVESGVDFEQKILEIYQNCRTPQEIEKEFNKLQNEMEDKISKTMKKAKEALFENFDADVHERLKLSVNEYLDRYTRFFWAITKYKLSDMAKFNDEDKSFQLNYPVADNDIGTYSLISKGEDDRKGMLYRMSHPLGQYILDKSINETDMIGKVTFDITNHKGYKISQVDQLKGKCGYLTLYKYTINSFENEEYLLFAGRTTDGQMLSPEQCQKLFECGGTAGDSVIPKSIQELLVKEIEQYAIGTLERSNEQNLIYVREEEDRLDRWVEDMIHAIEKELVNVKFQIRENERKLRMATSTVEHLEIQQKLQELNKRKRSMRVRLEENEDEIMEKRNDLICEIRKRIENSTDLNELFTIEWEVI